MIGDELPSGGLFGEICAAMADPGFYGHEPARVEVRETAISVVFLAAELVYKLKKPVVLPFLDQREPERRRVLCFEELRLNRRLAEDEYLGVRAIVRDGRHVRLGDAGDDGALEWAVEMRRLPQQRSMAALLEAGMLGIDDVRASARRS